VKRIYSLKGKKSFKEIYSKGKRNRGRFVAVYVLTAEARKDQEEAGEKSGKSDVKIGITVGKKLGKAHYRNLIKRRIRAVCGELLSSMHGGSRIIINPGPSVKDVTFTDLKDDIRSVFRKAGLMQ